MMADFTRRQFVTAAAGLATSRLFAQDLPRAKPARGPKHPAKKLAVVATAYYYLSHAYHIGGRLLHGYLKNGKLHHPDFALAGMYVEQQKENDLSRDLAKKHGFT